MKIYNNNFSYKVTGRYALFTSPMTVIGGEKTSLPIPTYEGIKGLTKSIYWKPSIEYVIDKVRIINPIKRFTKGVLPLSLAKGKALSYYSYLEDVHYEVYGHFVFTKNSKLDNNVQKHASILKRAIQKGGRMNPFLGTSECFAYIEPIDEPAISSYQNIEIDYGLMYHSKNFSNNKLVGANFAHISLKDGTIHFDEITEFITTEF